MIVSLRWLADYVPLDMTADELALRLMMAGLNHESTESVGDDVAIDLEVTSNRPDCLGHIGIAREVAVLWDLPLKLPTPAPAAKLGPVEKLMSVAIECPELCSRYTARVVRGVKVGPSPEWLARRLETIGVPTINNVVDISNYVLMECGQPLHAFDFGKLAGGRIVVREAKKGETFEAIDHRTYSLVPGMCVIADADRTVAIGGVMGGADTEVGPATKDLLIESAAFDQISIRATARKLHLHSPSSYRFERGVDPEGIDWASRRCAELVLDLCGGELAEGVVDVGAKPAPRPAIVLRYSQLKRVLGIDIPADLVRKILAALGLVEKRAEIDRVEVVPPSWRRDISREIDLVEEAARIHGYKNIPEDVGVPMVASKRSHEDRALQRVREILIASGMDEAMTVSAVSEAWSDAFSPWTDKPPLVCQTPVLRRQDRLRRSLVPSLLGARRTNESLSNPRIELFEIAKVYWPQSKGLPREERMLALASGGDFLHIKGILEAVAAALSPEIALETRDFGDPLFEAGRGAAIAMNGEIVAYLGEASAAGRKAFDLRGPATVAEVRLAPLVAAARLVRQYKPLSPYPAIEHDLNYVFDERVRWADVAAMVESHGGELLENLAYRDTYRDDARLGKGKKSLLFSLALRSKSGTLTSEEADAACHRIDAALCEELGGELRA